MKKTRFTDEQMVTILREADQRPVLEVAKRHGVSAETIYSWRKHFGTLEPADVKRLRQLEQENGRLKKMVADRDLEIDVLQEITQKKWWAHVCAGSRSRMRADAGCRVAEAEGEEHEAGLKRTEDAPMRATFALDCQGIQELGATAGSQELAKLLRRSDAVEDSRVKLRGQTQLLAAADSVNHDVDHPANHQEQRRHNDDGDEELHATPSAPSGGTEGPLHQLRTARCSTRRADDTTCGGSIG